MAWSVSPACILGDEGAGSASITVTPLSITTAQTVSDSTSQNRGSSNNRDCTGKLNEALAFAAGQTQRTFSIPIFNDTAVKSDETSGRIVQNLPGDPLFTFLATANVTIFGNDTAALVRWPPTRWSIPVDAVTGHARIYWRIEP